MASTNSRRTVAAAWPVLVAACAMAALLCGCGNSRTPAPQVSAPAPPAGFRTLNLPSAAASLSVPRNWVQLGTQSRQLLVLDTSGGGVIDLWRYPLSGRAPHGASQLQVARQRLIAAARTRDPSLRVISARVTEVAGHPAISLNAVERIGHVERHIVSTHVFNAGEELVLEEYAPPQFFASVDRTVFVPVLRSLTLTP